MGQNILIISACLIVNGNLGRTGFYRQVSDKPGGAGYERVFKLACGTAKNFCCMEMVSDCEHLIIDGYNVMHAWEGLRTFTGKNPEAGRNRLAERVRILHDFEGVSTSIVFDGKGERVEMEAPWGGESFVFLFSPTGVTADTVIERLVARARKPERIVVVSEDHLVGETAAALGAQPMSVQGLEDWIRAAERRQSGRIRRHHEKVDREWKGE